MPRWGRPPGARLGREVRRRGLQWEDDDGEVRVEEIESEEDGYDRGMLLDEYYGLRRDGSRRQSRRHSYEYEDETESSEGVDYNLDSDADSTVAYAVQLAMMDKEERLVDKALERIRRAQLMGKKNVRLSQEELDALERRRMRTAESKETQRKKGASSRPSLTEKRKDKSNGKIKGKDKDKGKNEKPITKGKAEKTEKRKSMPASSATERPLTDGWTRNKSVPSGYYSSPGGRPSSSSSQRPRTPSSQSARAQQSGTSPRSQLPQRYASVSEHRPTSSSRHQAFPRPLPDDPQWVPRSRASSNAVPYPYDPAGYLPYGAIDPRYSYHVRRDMGGFPDGPYRATRRSPSDDSSTSESASPPRAPTESSSEESSSSEDDDDESEDGRHGVKVAVEKPVATGSQTRSATASATRGSRARRGRRK
ncbi:COPII vesicles protein Yip3, putative [Paecilomyces variotii No. 5]|uniref:COPII vesicles protein Yip3, putative n=1 Tax=Byssochlamys spectabilis (strain No. 5 / NBRC 109023) TaxID=1356009 RepID=V5I163_BYSSN|nr:COPII vesicles protein Yip3, putative [Paecilomyces variotii No. 5]